MGNLVQAVKKGCVQTSPRLWRTGELYSIKNQKKTRRLSDGPKVAAGLSNQLN